MGHEGRVEQGRVGAQCGVQEERITLQNHNMVFILLSMVLAVYFSSPAILSIKTQLGMPVLLMPMLVVARYYLHIYVLSVEALMSHFDKVL